MFSFFYNLFLALYLLIALPFILFGSKKKVQIFKRFGIKKNSVDLSNKKPIIWIHAVSLGETKASKPLIELIRQDYKNSFIVFSSITNAGYIEAKKNIKADLHLFLPFDFSWIVKSVFKQIQPSIVIFIETDFWYHFFKYSKKLGAKIFVVSAKMSKRSSERFSKFKFFSKKLFGLVDHIFVQNEEYKNRFIQSGALPEKISITGNLKFDQKVEFLTKEQKLSWIEKLKLENKKVVTIASTHEPEERLLLEILLKIWQKKPDLKVLIAPRHSERYNLVQGVLEELGLEFGAYSNLDNLKGSEQVILLDTMGFLNIAYQLSDLAILGGSYIERVGGHNILEPVFVNTPVFFGPFMHTQEDLKRYALQYRAGKQIELSDLENSILYFLNNPDEQEQMKKSCVVLKENIQGSAVKTWNEIKAII